MLRIQRHALKNSRSSRLKILKILCCCSNYIPPLKLNFKSTQSVDVRLKENHILNLLQVSKSKQTFNFETFNQPKQNTKNQPSGNMHFKSTKANNPCIIMSLNRNVLLTTTSFASSASTILESGHFVLFDHGKKLKDNIKSGTQISVVNNFQVTEII